MLYWDEKSMCQYIQIVNISSRKSGVVSRGQPWHIASMAGLQVYTSDQSCTWGMIHTNIHFISPGCPQPSVAYSPTVQNYGLKYHSLLVCLIVTGIVVDKVGGETMLAIHKLKDKRI